MRYIVAAFDPDGLPRAYGLADTIDGAREVCKEQLAVYRAAKAAVDDPLATAHYTLKFARIEGFNDATWHIVR